MANHLAYTLLYVFIVAEFSMDDNDDKITVDEIVDIMDQQRKEAWDNSYENPKNYDAMRKILDDLGL